MLHAVGAIKYMRELKCKTIKLLHPLITSYIY